MNTIEFNGFDELQNSEYISSSKMFICGQGLVDTYWYVHFGNGYNKYTFVFENNGKIYEFNTEDKFINEWRSITHDEGNMKEVNAFYFEAFGNFDGYINKWIYSSNCDDNTLFIIDNIDFKLIKIIAKIIADKKPIDGIMNEDIFIQKKKEIKNIEQLNDVNYSLLQRTVKQVKRKKEYIFKDDKNKQYKIKWIDMKLKYGVFFKIKGKIMLTTYEIKNKCVNATFEHYLDGDGNNTVFKTKLECDLFGNINIYEFGNIYEIIK